MTDAADGRPRFRTLCLIGVGLIGASLALAARRAGLADRIVAAARRAETRETALRLGIVDAATADPAEAARGADLVVICTPVGAFESVARAIGSALSPEAIVTDVGSVKTHVVEAVAPHLPPGVRFVPGHPVAGTEQSGPEAGFAELFDDRWCILTPLPDRLAGPDGAAERAAVDRLAAFWRAVGSRVEEMTPEHHDRVLAVTSHMPHLIAFAIVGTASDLETVTDAEVMKFSAGGFRDFTRIAASDPTMWRDVFLTNRPAMLELLGRFTEDLIALQRAIRWSEGDALYDHFERVREIRRGVVELGQDTAEPDFGRRPSPAPGAGGDAEDD